MRKRNSANLAAFYSMAAVGGFFAGYTILQIGAVGAAQTGNMLEVILNIIGRDFGQILIRLGVVGVYAAAIFITRVLKELWREDIRILGIFVSAAGIVSVILVPESINKIIAICPIVFAASFQYNSFTGACGYTSACIFSSNNLRQAVDAAAQFCCTRDKEAGRKCLFFCGSLISFHLGAAAYFEGYLLVGCNALLAAYIPLLSAVVFTNLSMSIKHKNLQENI